jgi:cytidylate kinase
LAERLAETLGYPRIADEVLQDAAERLGVSKEAVQGKFETAPGLWARLNHERERYLVAVRSALADAAVGGRLVYDGLAGPFLLRGLRGVLRLRLIAPLEMRVRAVMEADGGMTLKAAEEFIHSVDQDRRRRVRIMYGEDVEDPSRYDLTVNLRALSLDAACAVVAEAAAEPRFAITPDVQAELEAFASACRVRMDMALAGGG